MGYAFISYSTKNQSEGDSVRALFNKKGIKTWMAPYDIPAGSGYASEITQAIKNCACFVLLLSKSAQSSMWVDKEVERALSHKKSVIVIQLEDIILNDSFEFYLGNCQIQSVKKIDENADGFQKILDAVVALTGRELTVKQTENGGTQKKKEIPIQTSPRQKKAITALHFIDGFALLCIIAGIVLLVKSENVFLPLAVFVGILLTLSVSTIIETAILIKAKKACGATEDADESFGVLSVLCALLGILSIIFFFLGSPFELYALAFSATILLHSLLATVFFRQTELKDAVFGYDIIFGILTVVAVLVYLL